MPLKSQLKDKELLLAFEEDFEESVEEVEQPGPSVGMQHSKISSTKALSSSSESSSEESEEEEGYSFRETEHHSSYEEEPQATEEQPQAIEEQFQNAEEQFQATEEQFQVTEEQLKATEEQLQATEEQVTGRNLSRSRGYYDGVNNPDYMSAVLKGIEEIKGSVKGLKKGLIKQRKQ